MGGRGGGGKGRPQHRHRYWGGGKGGRNGGHGKRGGAGKRHVEFDIDEVCNGLGELQNLAEPVEVAAKLCGQLCSQAFDSFMETCSQGAEERERLQSALEGGFPCFPKSQRKKLREKLAPHGFELDDTGGSSEDYSRPERGPERERGGGTKRRKEGRRERLGHVRRSRKVADEIKARQPWNQVGKDGLTGANSIKVNWKCPETSEDAAKEGDSSCEAMPAKPPSPVRGPVGRGRANTRPAWMTQGSTPAASPALADSAATKAEPSRSPVRGPGGHGRGSVVPPWKKQGSDPPSPSIPKGGENGEAAADKADKVAREPAADAREPPAEPIRSSWKDSAKEPPPWKDSEKEPPPWKDSEKEPHWKEDDSGWGSAPFGRSGHKSRRSRSRSKRRGSDHEEWYSSRDSGRAEWGKDDSWNQDSGWGQSQGSKWGRASWGGRWQAGNGWQESHQEPQQEWEDEVLVCSIHKKKRSWDKLVQGPDRTWVCREGVECVIYIGGSKASKLFAPHGTGAGRAEKPGDSKADPAHSSRRSNDRSLPGHKDDHRQAGALGHQKGNAATGRTASAGGSGRAPPPPPPPPRPAHTQSQWASQAMPLHPAIMSPFAMGPPATYPSMCGGYAPHMPVMPQMHPATSVGMTPPLPAAALHSSGSSGPVLASHVQIDAEDL